MSSREAELWVPWASPPSQAPNSACPRLCPRPPGTGPLQLSQPSPWAQGPQWSPCSSSVLRVSGEEREHGQGWDQWTGRQAEIPKVKGVARGAPCVCCQHWVPGAPTLASSKHRATRGSVTQHRWVSGTQPPATSGCVHPCTALARRGPCVETDPEHRVGGPGHSPQPLVPTARSVLAAPSPAGRADSGWSLAASGSPAPGLLAAFCPCQGPRDSAPGRWTRCFPGCSGG